VVYAPPEACQSEIARPLRRLNCVPGVSLTGAANDGMRLGRQCLVLGVRGCVAHLEPSLEFGGLTACSPFPCTTATDRLHAPAACAKCSNCGCLP